MNRFIEALPAASIDGTYIRWLNMIAKTPLLIIDDFGLQPLNHDMRLTLLQILEDRFAKGAANAHKIELKGESLRKKKNN